MRNTVVAVERFSSYPIGISTNSDGTFRPKQASEWGAVNEIRIECQMPNVRPMRIPGKWRQGYVLDYHTLRSEFVGHDEFGHPMFDTERTELGELLYKLKYGADRSVLQTIVSTVSEFLRSWNPPADAIIPTPPSRASRRFQPVLEIAKGVSIPLSIPCLERVLVKRKQTPELKSVHDYDNRLRILEDVYGIGDATAKGKNILLLDDLYRSGATLNAITELLYSQGEAADVYALALTRTRSVM